MALHPDDLVARLRTAAKWTEEQNDSAPAWDDLLIEAADDIEQWRHNQWRAAGVAAGPQATPQVLWEGETIRSIGGSDGSWLPEVVCLFDVPGGTRVRVVAAPTGTEDNGDA